MSSEMMPWDWVCAALSADGRDKHFKLLSISSLAHQPVILRVLHKDTGAVWVLTCGLERAAAQ